MLLFDVKVGSKQKMYVQLCIVCSYLTRCYMLELLSQFTLFDFKPIKIMSDSFSLVLRSTFKQQAATLNLTQQAE